MLVVIFDYFKDVNDAVLGDKGGNLGLVGERIEGGIIRCVKL